MDAKEPRPLVVSQGHPRAGDRNPGTEDLPLRTINAAAQRAHPGDTVLVRAGVYRETVVPARGGEEGRPITYQAAPGEAVAIKGSNLYAGAWEPAGAPGVFAARLNTAGLPEGNPFAAPLLNRHASYAEKMPAAIPRLTLGQVFVDGAMLDEVESEEELNALPGTWLAGERILVHFPAGSGDPACHQVELSVRKAVFRPERRGLGYLTIRGFRMEHAANQALTNFWKPERHPQQGMVSCRSGHHWVIEGNSVRFSKSVGLDVGSEGRMESLDGQATPDVIGFHRIQGNVISDHGQCAICGLGHIGTQILGNVIERNNNLGASTWEEAAIKTHFYIHGLIEGNLIRDNYTTGIWLDNVYQDVRITRNVILGNHGFGGIFLEMGSGPCLVDHNVIGLSTEGAGGGGGNGVYAHDAGGITVAHNLLLKNAGYGVYVHVVGERRNNVYPEPMRSFAQKPVGSVPCHCSHNRVVNNVFAGNHRGAANLPYPGPVAEENVCDGNLFDEQIGPVLFAVNGRGGTPLEEILAALARVEDEHGVPPAERGRVLPVSGGILVSFATWRLLMGMDGASELTKLSNLSWQIVHPGPAPWLTFRADAAVAEVTCEPVPGLERDFFGAPLPAERPAPGPFQAVRRAGDYRFRLWPK